MSLRLMAKSADPLDNLPHQARIRSHKRAAGVVTIIADATGLDGKARERIEQELRAAALAIPGVTEARVAMTAAQPHRTLIAIGSGKGGVGKSTVSVNLAVALARLGKRAGLVDADVYDPSQPTLLGCATKPQAHDDQLIPVHAHGITFLSLGQLVSPGHALAWAVGERRNGPAGRDRLGRCRATAGRSSARHRRRPAVADPASRPAGAIVVSTLQDLSLIDARRVVDLFNKMSVPVLGVIENMATYVCPHCGEASHPFGTGGAEAAAEEMGVPFLGRLPLSLAIREASDAGHPPAAGDGPDAEAFAALARKLFDRLQGESHATGR